MKQNIFSLFLVLTLSSVVFSQREKSFNYSKDFDTGSYRYLGVGMCYDLSINPFNSTIIALGLDATYLGDKFYANVTSRFHLVSKLVDEFFEEPATRTIYRDNWSRDLTINGTVFFSRFTQSNKFLVSLKKTGSVEYVSMIPATETVFYGAEIGFTFMTTYYKMREVSLTAFNRQGEPVNYSGSASTFLTQNVLRLGVSRSSTIDFKISTDKYGDKTSRGISKYYFHTLIAIGQRLDDVFRSFPEEPEIDVYQRLDINTNTKFLPVGAAIGLQSDGVGNFVNMGYGIEAGMMPGPNFNVLNNLYLDFKLRLNIGKVLK